MSKKIQAALSRKAPGATLIINDSGSSWDVELEAPQGHSWAGDVHSYVISWFVTPGHKAEFWAEVRRQIEDLPEPEPCTGNCPAAPENHYGDNMGCEYWNTY